MALKKSLASNSSAKIANTEPSTVRSNRSKENLSVEVGASLVSTELWQKSTGKVAKSVKITFKDFIDFISQNTVLGLAVALVMGNAVSMFVSSFVNGVIMPFISLIVPATAFDGIVFRFQGAKFLIGDVISSAINLLVISWFIYVLVKWVLRSEKLLEYAKVKRVKKVKQHT